jgi:hypothetical protein
MRKRQNGPPRRKTLMAVKKHCEGDTKALLEDGPDQGHSCHLEEHIGVMVSS